MSASSSGVLFIALAAVLLAGCGNPNTSEETPKKVDRKSDEAAIRKNLADYIAIYQKRDAAALAAMWSESGKFLDPQTGEAITGRKGIEEALAALFKESGDVTLEVEILSLRFLADDVAVEEGEAKVAIPDVPPTVGRYQAIHVKKGGKWLIDSIRETATESVVEEVAGAEGAEGDEGGVPELEELAWMIGEWDDVGEGATIELSVSWGMEKSFIRRDFAVVVEDRVEMDGIEVIGWDADGKQFRSWVFDSGGGFGSATWEKSEEDGWLKKMSGTTREGKKVYAVHLVKSIDENTYEWQAHGREMDGVPLPNIDPVQVVRVSNEESAE